jgi:hypothetical protein
MVDTFSPLVFFAFTGFIDNLLQLLPVTGFAFELRNLKNEISCLRICTNKLLSHVLINYRLILFLNNFFIPFEV